MYEETGRRKPAPHRHGQYITDQLSFHAPVHRPANDFAAIQVQYRGQIQPSLIAPQVGDITDPFLIGRTGCGILLEQVRSHWQAMVRISGCFEARRCTGPKTLALRAFRYGLTVMTIAVLSEVLTGFGSRIGLAVKATAPK